jgi:NADH-quinone oxidoreductase subunit C
MKDITHWKEKINEKLSTLCCVEEKLGVIKIKCDSKDIVNISTILSKEFDVNGFIGAFGTHYQNAESIVELRYMFISYKENFRVEIVAEIKDGMSALSLTDLYSGAEWYEREIFDMLGVKFSDLKDHRRILTDYNFEHHPLRKDFPVVGYNEVRYDFLSGEVRYFENNFSQDYKQFDSNMQIDTKAVFDKIKTTNS